MLGALAFVIGFALLIRPLIMRGALAALWPAMACLAVNIGEGIFFSMGGMGMFAWLMLALNVVSPERSISSVSARRTTGTIKRRQSWR